MEYFTQKFWYDLAAAGEHGNAGVELVVKAAEGFRGSSPQWDSEVLFEVFLANLCV